MSEAAFKFEPQAATTVSLARLWASDGVSSRGAAQELNTRDR